MAFKKSRKAHVTFDDSKRIISYEKDEEVDGLRHLFLRVFSDMLSDDVAPANVRFQQYDDIFKDYVDLGNGQKLEENARLKAITISSTKGNKVHGCCKPEGDHHCSNCHPRQFVIPWYPWLAMCCIDDPPPANPPDLKFHSIKKDVPYRFWNPVSNGLVHNNDSNVTCKGGFSDKNNLSVIQAKSVGDNLFHLVFNGDGPTNDYLYITSQGEGQQVIVRSSPTDESVFVPDYYWGQTMFRSNQYRTLYLGSDSDRNAVLVPMEDSHYPNPQALFVVNKYDPAT
ncbi:hypothetical protein ACROYT_G037258 [Oculina patagonica]